MVHPTVTDEAERQRQRRFIGVMLATPFLAAGAAVTLVTSSLGAAVTVAAIFGAFGLCWFAALLVAATGRMTLAGRASVATGGLALAGAIAAAGGLASPVALLAVALPVESWWIAGSRRAAISGALAAFGAILLQPFANQFLPLGESAIAGWHWL
ncbi:MAG: PAS domain-containing sensor histidine kinase, partial [Mesorhizobium sp.]